MKNYKENLKGIYLVLDPSVLEEELIQKLKSALQGGISIVQIWNNWPKRFKKEQKLRFIDDIYDITKKYNIPILINNEWELLENENIDGVHFDSIPSDLDDIRGKSNRGLLFGITCSNDLATVAWAERNKLDYISFCTMFPSPSVDSCEIVNREVVLMARKVTQMPLFLSGGITHNNLKYLNALDFQGVAVISGVLDAKFPDKSVKEFNTKLNKRMQ